MIIDCHNHVLGTGMPAGHRRFIREMRGRNLRATGALPDHREVDEADWEGLEHVWEPVDPQRLIDDHRRAGVDRSTVLSVAPSTYTRYEERGTVDLAGVTGVPGPPSIDKANDYIAALAGAHDELFGMAAVNPRHRGVDHAREELRRAVEDLGLVGLKLYPMYDHYRVDDRDLAFGVFDRALELDVGVMVHMGTTPARDAILDYGRPAALDDVARAFPRLRLLVCHVAFPWIDECLALVARHANLYVDVSSYLSTLTQRETYDFLQRARRVGCPWSRICWATDYPGGGMPQVLLPRFALVNDVADGGPQVPATDMARMLGGNWARFAGLASWSEEQTLAAMTEREPQWRAAAGAGGTV